MAIKSLRIDNGCNLLTIEVKPQEETWYKYLPGKTTRRWYRLFMKKVYPPGYYNYGSYISYDAGYNYYSEEEAFEDGFLIKEDVLVHKIEVVLTFKYNRSTIERFDTASEAMDWAKDVANTFIKGQVVTNEK